MPTFLKIGNLINSHGFVYPALLPTNNISGIAFEINETNREEIHFALQHYIIQLVKRSNDGFINLTIVDTKKMGTNFRLLRKLNKKILSLYVSDEDNQKSVINEHYNKSVTINECLAYYSSLSEYNKKSGHIYPFRILAIADFPHGFNSENLKKLNSLLTNAEETGIFIFNFLHHSINAA